MRRRCCWCGVELSWWQLNACRRCGYFMRWDLPGPPCAERSRWLEESDPWRVRKAPISGSSDE